MENLYCITIDGTTSFFLSNLSNEEINVIDSLIQSISFDRFNDTPENFQKNVYEKISQDTSIHVAQIKISHVFRKSDQ